ncbi:glycosyltransferase family 4 protein [Candidatus Saccharibacteria bacterium]|nr:glycosyltransferase family 4 protein [Candidatus Saccharibacteria bacterium]
MERSVFLVRNVGPDNFGGGEIYQLKLARELKEHGFVPIIITNSKQLLREAKKENYKALVPPYCKRQNWSGWRNVLLPLYWMFQMKLAKWYKKMIEKYEPVVINIQSRDDMIAGTKMAKKMGIRVLWTDHADFRNWVLWNVNARYKNVIGKRIIKLSSDVARVIFVGKKVAEETKEMIKPSSLHNAVVIENGIVDEKSRYEGTKAVKDSFIFVGRITKEKGIDELARAFLKIREKYPDVVLNIYGDGEAKWKEKLKGAGIKYHGHTNEPLKVMAENEIFILPSYREGLSLSLLEAAMMEKKIIASDVDGNPEVVVNGETGLLVSAKDADKLAEAMMWMLENKEKAETMAKNARKKYEREFNFEKIFEEKMLPLYNVSKERK